MRILRSYLTLAIWLACFVGTTGIMLLQVLMTKLRKSRASKPYFTARSIFTEE